MPILNEISRIRAVMGFLKEEEEIGGLKMNVNLKSFVEMDLFSDNPVVTLSPEAFNPAKVDQLDEDMKKFLLEIKRIILS